MCYIIGSLGGGLMGLMWALPSALKYDVHIILFLFGIKT